MTENKEGLVLRCIGGFYYVEAADTVYTCRARGAFRRQGLSPVAGDRAIIEVDPSDGTGVLMQVLPRKNVLVRPPVANVDNLVLVGCMLHHATLLNKI